MSQCLVQIFVAVFLLLSPGTFASVGIPSDDSDLTESILDAKPTSGVHFFSDVDDVEQTSVKRRNEAAIKHEEKVFDIPHADKLPIKDYASEYVTSNNPSSIQDDKPVKDSTEGADVRPITFKLTSSNNQDDSVAKDKQLDDEKAKDESVKITVSPPGRTSF